MITDSFLAASPTISYLVSKIKSWKIKAEEACSGHAENAKYFICKNVKYKRGTWIGKGIKFKQSLKNLNITVLYF